MFTNEMKIMLYVDDVKKMLIFGLWLDSKN